MEPSYEDQDGQPENVQSGRTVGFVAADDPFTGDRWTNDEMSDGASGQQRGARTPEQQAEDLLRQAEDLEPDYDNYDFESAEGGNGSPPQEGCGHSLEQVRATDVTTEYGDNGELRGRGLMQTGAQHADIRGAGQMVHPGCTGRESGVDPGWTGSEHADIQGAGQMVHPGCTGRESGIYRSWTADECSFRDGQHSTGRGDLPGWTGSGRGNFSHSAFEHAREPGCAGSGNPGRRRFADAGQAFRAELNGYSRGASEQPFDGKSGMRNSLEDQLSQMLGHRSDGRGAPPGNSARVEALEGLVAQLLQREIAISKDERSHEGIGSVQSSDVSRAVPKEGRGWFQTGEPRESKSRLGKGVGVQGTGVPMQVFQPPWTSFQHAPDGVASAACGPLGPGEALLEATRAMQNVTLQEFPDLRPFGSVMYEPTAPATSAHMSGSRSTCAAEAPDLKPSRVPAPEVSGSELRRAGEVTVVINGIARRGRFNEQGEVILIPETPKYFAMDQGGNDVQQPVSSENARGEREQSGHSLNVGCSNPFSANATSPFRASTQAAVSECSRTPPPPPPPSSCAVSARVPRAPSRSPNGMRYGYARRPSRSPNPSPPRPISGATRIVNASPATPGGTRIPSGPPPRTPPTAVGNDNSLGAQGLNGKNTVGAYDGSQVSQGLDKEYVPGERTYWELPVLASPNSEQNPAMRCNDWIYKIGPLMSDLAPKANAWWALVLQEAQDAYQRWSVAKPLDRAKIIGKPSSTLQEDRFIRIESRGVAMLSKALPSVVYEQALSSRNVSCVGLLFLALRIYQPGGLNERAELLRGLTTLQVFDSATSAVSGLQKWFRHLERANAMSISVPDSSLLLDSIDKSLATILQANSSMNFRMHSVRMQLQLDTMPVHSSVEEYARTVLAELELLAVAAPENTAKRQRIASVTADPLKGKGSGKPSTGNGKTNEVAGTPSGTPSRGNGPPKKACAIRGVDTESCVRFLMQQIALENAGFAVEVIRRWIVWPREVVSTRSRVVKRTLVKQRLRVRIRTTVVTQEKENLVVRRRRRRPGMD